MITKKEWQSYLKYVEEYNQKVTESHRKTMKEFCKVTVTKHKFLWFSWETKSSASENMFGFPPYLEPYKKPTLEDCLNWLTNN